MPANDQFWRPLSTMHKVFAISAVALLLATYLMMAKDHRDEWRVYQATADQLKASQLTQELSQAQAVDYQEKLQDLNEQQKETARALEEESAAMDKLRTELTQIQGDVDLLARQTKFKGAERDVARANYDIAVRDARPDAELQILKAKFDALQQAVDDMNLELEQKKQTLTSAKSRLEEETKAHDKIAGEIKELTKESERIAEALTNIAPDQNHAFQRFKRWLMLQPIIDGFNSPHGIKQEWLPDLPITLGMATTARFDRCRTCHVNINDFKSGNVPAFPHGEFHEGKYPHPFSAHPEPDVYLTATSPHPMPKFGCTICHDGDGSGTSFQNAEHTPNNPAMAEEWHKEYGWHSNHFWEYPMQPDRFIESSCIKCHHSVVELGVNAEYGATAPKVYEGYEIIKTYGCFGCHEINGYDGAQAIGPDLRLEPQTEEETAKYAADPNQIPGRERKVGPSLRHIAAKTTPEFVAYWTEEPSRFRPSTKMPQFFHLSNQQDETAQHYQPVQIAAIAAYLEEKSQPIELEQPQEGYQPDPERGKSAFARRGCLACHSYDDPAFAGSSATFGPDLSKIHEKIKPGQEGFNWLYTWVRDPTRHHTRTKMPDLYLDPEGEGENYIDPAADIAAFLLQGGGRQFPSIDDPKPYLGLGVEETPDGVRVTGVSSGGPASQAGLVGGESAGSSIASGDLIKQIGNSAIQTAEQYQQVVEGLAVGEPVDVTLTRNGAKAVFRMTVSTPLNDLFELFVRKSLTKADYEKMNDEFRYPLLAADIKGDEVELAAREGDPEKISPEEWDHRKLVYVGRRTISFYGCYGCHDIPEFESARPIGTALQDWGRKDTSKLALEHIEEFLHHHGAGHGNHETIPEIAEHAVEREIHDGDASQQGLTTAFYYENLLHHGRPGFIWQKLRQPRSYDYKKIETKGYDERLRMPKFPFTDEQIEAVTTFVLGLVADPPPSEYIFQPDRRKADVIEGERLLDKYNCGGCHIIDLPEVAYATNPEELFASELDAADYEQGLELLMQLKPPQDGLERTPTGQPVTTKDGENVVRFKGLVFAEPDYDEDPEFQEFSYDLWETLEVGEKTLYPGSKMLVPAAKVVEQTPSRGGDFAHWLVPHLMETQTDGNRFLAWQASPPPLYKEGIKVQTPWLYEFLKNPGRIRYTTVLRMPKFNMSDDEARSLANYFAAADMAEYPYQSIPEQQPPYLHQQQVAFHDAFPEQNEGYLAEAWNVLNAPLCMKCHSVGGNEYKSNNPKQDIRGPDLDRVAVRLRPDWTMLWLYKPAWITPYTSMPTVFPRNQTQLPELFGGDGQKQTVAVRDALMNYYKLMEAHGQITYTPEAAAEAPQTGAGGE